MKLPKIDQVKSRGHAISLAIDWQRWSGEHNLSYGEIAYSSNYFADLAEKFNLTEEFKENGII